MGKRPASFLCVYVFGLGKYRKTPDFRCDILTGFAALATVLMEYVQFWTGKFVRCCGFTN